MPTWQGIEFLERVLTALAGQETDIAWDFSAIDSGSTDGTWECLGRHAETFPVPFRRRRIHKLEFDHGDTRNELAAGSTGDLLVFLTQDAIPASPRWLATLAANFDDPGVGAAYCRNAPRTDANLLTRIFSAEDDGYWEGRRVARVPPPEEYARLNGHERRFLYNFNDVASAVRRELWERHPFPRTWFGEDVLMARGILEAGFAVVYDTDAVVEHSHDYDEHEMFERGRLDGRFNAEWIDRITVVSRADAKKLARHAVERDRAALAKEPLDAVALEQATARAEKLRSALFDGMYEGAQARARQGKSRMLDRTKLKILYVVHGFPPDTWAGTEIYTYNLASEMQRRGHEVTILTRVPASKSVAEGGPADFSIEDTNFQGLRVLRMTHRLEHKSLRESFRQPRAEAAFRALLLREPFDVVHFQHLIHLSVGLVEVARERNLATLITCNDYWAICSRVQMIRPDGVRCEENMRSGCFLCVKERGLAHIPRMKQLDRVAAPLLDAMAAGSRHGRRLGAGLARRWEGFAEMRSRHDSVTSAFKAADLLIGPSRFLRQKMIDSGGFDEHTFVYSDYGMRTDYLKALEKRPDAKGRIRFGFVGSLVWYKGDEVMLRAMRDLDPARAVLQIHGDFKPEKDAHHAELKAIAGPAVEFCGRFDNSRLSEVYATIDVLIVPSIWFENSPLTIHEAFLTNTPVVASDIGGMAELVTDGVDGLHFKTGDAADLAKKLRRFVDEPDLIERLSKSWMHVKSIEEDGASTEYRYRALVCRHAAQSPARGTSTLLEWAGIDSTSRSGPVEEQGVDTLLLRPGNTAAEYSIEGAGGGMRRIRVVQKGLGSESHVVLGGRMLVDGREVARLPAVQSQGRDQTFTHDFDVEIPHGARRLRLECVSGQDGPATHLRIQRIVVLSTGSAVPIAS
jgi:glycosyltransferase involved in cell wall biosynthesis